MTLIDDVQQQLGPTQIQQISQELGIDPQTAQSAVQSALPMMVAGMAGTAQQPGGEQQIQSLFGAHGGTLGNLASAISGAAGGGGAGGILGTILGGHHKTVEDGVGQSTGLQPDQSKRLLMILAPIVLAVLARRHGSGAKAGSAGSVGGALQQDAQAAQQSSPPHIGGILGKILSHVQTPAA
jgi:hypothetical protein